MNKKWFKSLFLAIIILLICCSFGCDESKESSSLNTSSSDSSWVENLSEGIVLNYTSAKIEVYETLQLMATVNGDVSQVTWSSSDTDVAIVTEQGGFVTAVGEGIAVISASLESFEVVTCTITVSIPTELPVVQISSNNISLKQGESFSVSVTATWKDKPINADFQWGIVDSNIDEFESISMEISDDGKTATFTGLGVGEATYFVSTVINGIPFVEYVAVNSVDNDIYFDITNVNPTILGYTIDLPLVDNEGDLTYFTPELEVYYHGELQNAEIEWNNSDNAIATVDSNGRICGLKEGKTIVSATARFNNYISAVNITVNVYAPLFNFDLEEVQEIDLNSEGAIAILDLGEIKDNICGELVGATFGEKEFYLKVRRDNMIITDKASIGNIYGNEMVSLTFNRLRDGNVVAIEIVNIPVLTYRSISNAEQLNKLADYLQVNGTDVYGDFRMTADIDMKGKTLNGVGTYEKKGDRWYPTHIWHGSFDGQGYTIYNAVESGNNSGLFCTIGSGGVVKNVNFINVNLSGDTGLIATSNDGGLVEKVFVYGNFINNAGSSGIPQSMLVSKHGEGVINQCFVIINDSSLVDYGAMLAGRSSATITDCIAINLSSNPLYGVGSTDKKGIKEVGECGEKGIFGKSYQGIKKYLQDAESFLYDDWANEILNELIKNNIGASLTEDEIAIGSNAQIIIKNKSFVSSYTVDMPGVNIVDGEISVDSSAIVGETANITIDFVDNSQMCLSFKIIKAAINLSETIDFDVRKNSIQIDLSKFSNKPGVQLRTVSFDGNEVSNATLKNGILTLNRSAFGKGKYDWGNLLLTVRTETETYKIPLFVYVSIANADDLANAINYAYATGKDVYGTGQDRYVYMLLTNDINMDSVVFDTIGAGYYSGSLGIWSLQFQGVFDGNGFAIKNWTPPAGVNKGLFCCIGREGIVKNLRLLNATCNGSSLIATENQGVVENVFVEGRIANGGESAIPVGMLVGKNAKGKVRNCVVICTEVPNPTISYGAMLVGREGDVTNCLAINLSGRTIYGVGTNGKTVGESSEKANSTNKIFNSWFEYDEEKLSIKIDDWAEEYINSIRSI